MSFRNPFNAVFWREDESYYPSVGVIYNNSIYLVTELTDEGENPDNTPDKFALISGGSLSSGNPNSILFYDSEGNLSSSETFLWDGLRLGINTNEALAGALDIYSITKSQRLIFGSANFEYRRFGNAAGLRLARANGTFDALTQVLSSQSIGELSWEALDDTSTFRRTFIINTVAAENITSTAFGSYVLFEKVAMASTTRNVFATFDRMNNFGISPTAVAALGGITLPAVFSLYSRGSTSSTFAENFQNSSNQVIRQMRDDGVLILPLMPTSSAGLPSGALWNNSGVVNIV